MADAVKLPADLAELHRDLGIPADYAEKRGLVFQPDAQSADLVIIETKPDGTPVRLITTAARAWHAMQAAAQAEGITFCAVSGHRSIPRQAELIRQKRANGQRMGQILGVMAAPGYSEHHTGRAVDIATPEQQELEEHFAESPAFAWLQQNAARFGFRLSYPMNNPTGFIYEPWHWFWAG